MDVLPRPLPNVIAIVGPTSSGKSSLGLELAERFGGEIVSADSRQVYRGLDLGTAKPSAADQARVPHHLVDIRDPEEDFSAAEFKTAATRAITGILDRDRLPMLVGGTGLYIRAVLENLTIPEVAPNPALRAELELLPTSDLAARLTEADPETAAEIDLRNPRRIIRALEVLAATGRGLSTYRGQGPAPYHALKLAIRLEKAALDRRIEQAVRKRYADGVVEEVRALLDRGLTVDRLRTTVIAYGPAIAVVDGSLSETVAIERTIQLDQQYAKRQLTWFKRDPEIIWLDDPTDAVRLVEPWLTPREVPA